MPEDLKPNRSHVVLYVDETGEVLHVNVDPNFPDAYKQGEMHKLLTNLALDPKAKIGVIIGQEKFVYGA